jgi:hypothetical protein
MNFGSSQLVRETTSQKSGVGRIERSLGLMAATPRMLLTKSLENIKL